MDRTVLLLLFSLLLVASPLVGYWAADDSPWYLPYLLWGAIIGLTGWLSRKASTDDL